MSRQEQKRQATGRAKDINACLWECLQLLDEGRKDLEKHDYEPDRWKFIRSLIESCRLKIWEYERQMHRR